jgi:hypothetical protein
VLIHSWDAAVDRTEWQVWLAGRESFGTAAEVAVTVVGAYASIPSPPPPNPRAGTQPPAWRPCPMAACLRGSAACD